MCSLFKAKDMGIDLGTANTLIFIKGSGIVLNEPSVIAVENRDGKTLAVGHAAKAMLGKAPASISVVRPLQDGVISDFDRTADMLKSFLETALKVKRIRNFRVVVGVPSGVTEVEKRAVEEIVRQMGATEVFILEEPMAAAIGAGMPVDGTNGCMIADIGGGTTDVAIIALGGVVTSTSIRHAGDKMNEAIIHRQRMSRCFGFTVNLPSLNILTFSQSLLSVCHPCTCTLCNRRRLRCDRVLPQSSFLPVRLQRSFLFHVRGSQQIVLLQVAVCRYTRRRPFLFGSLRPA